MLQLPSKANLIDFLDTGPDLMASVFGTFFKFHVQELCIGGYIERMFLQVIINEED